MTSRHWRNRAPRPEADMPWWMAAGVPGLMALVCFGTIDWFLSMTSSGTAMRGLVSPLLLMGVSLLLVTLGYYGAEVLTLIRRGVRIEWSRDLVAPVVGALVFGAIAGHLGAPLWITGAVWIMTYQTHLWLDLDEPGPRTPWNPWDEP